MPSRRQPVPVWSRFVSFQTAPIELISVAASARYCCHCASPTSHGTHALTGGTCASAPRKANQAIRRFALRSGRPGAPAAPRIYEIVSVPGTQIAQASSSPLVVLVANARSTSHSQWPSTALKAGTLCIWVIGPPLSSL